VVAILWAATPHPYAAHAGESAPLVTGSLVATHSTFVGTTTDHEVDSVDSIATDAAGNVYLAGVTAFDTRYPNEPTFPTTPGSLRLPNTRTPDNPCEGTCGFILKLGPDLRIIYGALLTTMRVTAIAVDSAGAVYATGSYYASGGDPPLTPGAFSSFGQALVLKLSPDGSSLEYAAAFNGESRAIAVDGSGSAYVVGEIVGPGVLTTAGSLKPQYQDIPDRANGDGFILKIAPNGKSLVFGSYLGGTAPDTADGVAVDDVGRAVVIGRTQSTDFVGFSGPNAGAIDAYAVQLTSDGSAISSARYFGGARNDFAKSVRRDGQGGYLISGTTLSADFPVTPGVVQTRFMGSVDGWLARLDSNLNVRYSTYFGGSIGANLWDVASDLDARAYLVGQTSSADMLTTLDGFQDASSAHSASPTGGAGRDFYPDDAAVAEAFFAVLDPTGAQLEYGTYLGGYLTTVRNSRLPISGGLAVARSADGAVYVGGSTVTASFPSIAGGLRDTVGGLWDGFVVRFAPQSFAIASPTILPDARVETSYDYQLEARDGTAPYRWELVGFALPDGLSLSSGGRIAGAAMSAQTELAGRQFTVRVTDAVGRTAHKSLMINVRYDGNAVCTSGHCAFSLPVGTEFTIALPYPARGVAPFFLSTSGTLPPGMSLDFQKAVLGGRATTPGDYSFAFTVQDSETVTRTLPWQVTITGPPPVPAPPVAPAPAPAPPNPAPAGNVASSSGGGGGGAMAPVDVIGLLIAFAFMTAVRLRRRELSRPAW
jgi:hypothetical protein